MEPANQSVQLAGDLLARAHDAVHSLQAVLEALERPDRVGCDGCEPAAEELGGGVGF